MENKEICATCGGKCCKAMGCHIAPTDVPNTSYKTIKLLLDSETVSIDWWVGNPCDESDETIEYGYFLRMRNVDAPIVDPSWGGVCCLLTETGCPLEYHERPRGARELIPSADGKCRSTYTKKMCAIHWLPHNQILDKLAKEYR